MKFYIWKRDACAIHDGVVRTLDSGQLMGAAQVGASARLCRREELPSFVEQRCCGQTRGGGDSASRRKGGYGGKRCGFPLFVYRAEAAAEWRPRSGFPAPMTPFAAPR